PDIGPVPRLTLRDAVSGSKLLPQLAGKSVLVSFIAPRCTSTCPLTEGTIARVQDALRHTGRLSSRVALVLIATDIAHDTAAELRHLTRATGAISNVFHYATGSKEALNEVLQGYGVTVVPTEGSDGDLDHTAATYLVDKNSRVRAVFSPNAAPSTITQAIERL
ncbi:MAG: SCO family protein, partial [Vulcanimicrobiaceae bacterium]